MPVSELWEDPVDNVEGPRGASSPGLDGPRCSYCGRGCGAEALPSGGTSRRGRPPAGPLCALCRPSMGPGGQPWPYQDAADGAYVPALDLALQSSVAGLLVGADLEVEVRAILADWNAVHPGRLVGWDHQLTEPLRRVLATVRAEDHLSGRALSRAGLRPGTPPG